jgi:hypothetical protein
MSKMKNAIPETQEFLVIGSVVLLCRVEPSTVISNRVTLTAIINLLENRTDAEL